MQTFTFSFDGENYSIEVPQKTIEFFINYCSDFNEDSVIAAFIHEAPIQDEFCLDLFSKDTKLLMLLTVHMYNQLIGENIID